MEFDINFTKPVTFSEIVRLSTKHNHHEKRLYLFATNFSKL